MVYSQILPFSLDLVVLLFSLSARLQCSFCGIANDAKLCFVSLLNNCIYKRKSICTNFDFVFFSYFELVKFMLLSTYVYQVFVFRRMGRKIYSGCLLKYCRLSWHSANGFECWFNGGDDVSWHIFLKMQSIRENFMEFFFRIIIIDLVASVLFLSSNAIFVLYHKCCEAPLLLCFIFWKIALPIVRFKVQSVMAL